MAHVWRALANALLAWIDMRLPPTLEMLGWSDPTHGTYGTFASFQYVSSTMRVLSNVLTVFLNSLTARGMLSWQGELSHCTANAPASAHASAQMSAHASAPRVLTNAHRAEAFFIPTQGEATLTLLLLY
jgi:hypothetical protein